MPARLDGRTSDRDLTAVPSSEVDASHAHDAEDELPEAYCGGCGRLIDEESVEDGVIQFATKLWHIECFRCAKCKNRVSTERDDILLLSDGHPICGECNYSCNICHLPIMEEAIMTGDESYHASCFTCRSCHSKIEELVFAKTSQGIYCMKCHNERVARSRKHAEHKRAKARREKQIQEAQSAEPSHRSTLTTPGTSATTSSPLLDLSPSIPSKESSSPSPSILASPAPSGASLSPYIGQSSSSAASRPNNAAGKRPMNAPPPPSREARSPAMGAQARLDGRSALPSNASQASLSSITMDEPPRPQSRGYEVTAPLSPRKKTFGSGLDSSQGSPAAVRTGLPAMDAASSSPSPSASPLKKSFAMEVSPSRDSERTLRPSSREGLGVSLRTSSIRAGAAARDPLAASASSSRLSKVYSFYDPDFLNLVESFGDFGSNDELRAQAPPVPALPASIASTSRASSTSLMDAPPSPSALSTSSAKVTTSPSGSAIAKGSFDRDAAGQHDESLNVADDVDSEEEVLRDVRRNTAMSTGSLKEVSSRVRASMQQARDGQVSMDISFVETMLRDLEQTRQRMESLQTRYDRIRRASQQAAHGFTMAKEEFEHEVNARHEAELEMARLRRKLADQALKLATADSERRQHEQLVRRSQDVKASLKGMERDLAKLTVERDLTVAEVAELVALQDGAVTSPSLGSSSNGARSSTSTVDAAITQNLTSRLESVKSRYRHEIDELTIERDSLLIEIEELKQSKELFLEEAQTLNAKNEELNTVLAQLSRRVELAAHSRDQLPPLPPLPKDLSSTKTSGGGGFGFGSRYKQVSKHTPHNPSISSHDAPPSSAGYDTVSLDTAVQQVIKPGRVEPAPIAKKFKWMKPKLSETTKANVSPGQGGGVPPVPPKGPGLGTSVGGTAMTRATSHDVVVREHLFQPFNVLRPTRCFACQKNMWGQSEMRCALCTQVCHSRCLQNLPVSCNQPFSLDGQSDPAGPSMFGRSLTEQAAQEGRDVPIIVEKCIQAVEAFGMDYEGIYRKSGGTSQLKVITQLFDRGNAFDLEDTDRFNDVSAITSVLKNYFRELPTPLLTFELYDELIQVVESKQEDAATKQALMKELVERLPRQHYCTLQHLVLHLHHVQDRSADNRMNARNLGVVFGPTLMRSADPTQEFAHMGGKAMTIEFFIDHAPELFR
ncbi:Zinc finger, LIM-type [Kalmanozyma brasiliensis GHG001]|uniref:GTPase-activating protein beta-chimerin n=1 Tax=Kalmanozyma brasiliensis (strain GHG001) TaxID=1365824 RepID=V5GQ84_KALBG|nr:Zinc finger, LIM-type [Kalmanozyma brasiliensis GHG001]EST08092.1 Zinc finger, LIM-type [Kalmanozyma brasiliensis GHG001]